MLDMFIVLPRHFKILLAVLLALLLVFPKTALSILFFGGLLILIALLPSLCGAFSMFKQVKSMQKHFKEASSQQDHKKQEPNDPVKGNVYDCQDYEVIKDDSKK